VRILLNVKNYRPRIIDEVIERRLKSTGGILITGPKWCGKSTTGQFHAGSFVNMDIPENREQYLLAPDLILDGEPPRLIDEWQDTPSIWDRARRKIDERGKTGQYILTGSAVPAEQPSHTGTGRFARIQMRTMSLFESDDSSGSVSLKGLFEGHIPAPAKSTLTYEQAVALICRGGWPQILTLTERDALDVSRDYIEAVATSDISRTDGIRRDPQRVRLLLRSLARTITTAAKISTIRTDVSANMDNDGISEKSIHNYLNALRQIYVLQEQNAWTESLRSKTRIRTMPKRHFTDPSLAAAALAITPQALLRDTETAGFLFESMCIRDLDVYTQPLGGRVCYYRDENDFEVDAIIQLDDGRWGAAEIKMGTHQFDEAAGNLLRLKERMSDVLPPPSFLMILNATSGVSAMRGDGVWIVPIDCLGP
jgi:predicted AAA+ superfamily ATPase